MPQAIWSMRRTRRSSCCTTMSWGSFAEPATTAVDDAGILTKACRAALNRCATPTMSVNRSATLQIRGEPAVNFFIEVPAVLRLRYPMPGVRPHQKAAGHLHALQRAPILERVIDGHAKV